MATPGSSDSKKSGGAPSKEASPPKADRTASPSRSGADRSREVPHLSSKQVGRGNRTRKAVLTSAHAADRGLIARILHQNHFEIIFVQWRQDAVDRMNAAENYEVRELDEAGKTVSSAKVEKFRALHGHHNRVQVVHEMVTANIVICSVPQTEFKPISKMLAEAINVRAADRHGLRHDYDPLVVMTCHETSLLSSELSELVNPHLSRQIRRVRDRVVSFVDSTHDMMVVPDPSPNSLNTDIERSSRWYVNYPPHGPLAARFILTTFVPNIQFYTKRNEYIIKTGLAMTAYLAWNKGLRSMQQAITIPGIEASVRQALSEGAKALERYADGDEGVLRERSRYIDRFIRRLRNPALQNQAYEFGRGPIHKLRVERLFFEPACYLARSARGPGDEAYRGLLDGIAMALRFRNVEGDPESQELHRLLRENTARRAFECIFRVCYIVNPIFEPVTEIVGEIQEEIKREEAAPIAQVCRVPPGFDASRVRAGPIKSSFDVSGGRTSQPVSSQELVATGRTHGAAVGSGVADAQRGGQAPRDGREGGGGRTGTGTGGGIGRRRASGLEVSTPDGTASARRVLRGSSEGPEAGQAVRDASLSSEDTGPQGEGRASGRSRNPMQAITRPSRRG